ncbi:MAG: enoyl-CoA hydratase/isomerase family protein [Acidimicrobiia bacterium]
MPSRVRSYAEIAGALRSPYAADELVRPGEVPILAVDLDRGRPEDTEAETLRRIPAVTVALVDGPGGDGPGGPVVGGPVGGPVCGPDASAAPFDVVLDGNHGRAAAALDATTAGVEARPLAAVAAVQLLRLSASLGVVDGLVAESFTYSTLQSGPGFGTWLADRLSGRPPAAAPPAAEPPAAASSGVDPEPLLAERDGERLRITFNRPEVHNAFGFEVRDALVEALRLAVADRTIDSVVLAGRGPSFCSGGDLREFGTLEDPVRAHLIRTSRSAGYWLHRVSDRLSARVHGWCIGSGAELAAFAGHVSAAPDLAVFLPEVAMGLVPGAGGTVSLPRRIGRSRTAYLCLSGETIGAETALAWGLVDEVSEPHP